MKLLQIALVVIVFLINLIIAPPSWADKPKVSKNSDYIELTKSLERLQEEKESSSATPELKQKIDELQLQKAAIEAGTTWGQCRNETGKTLAIYGPASEDSKFDTELYFLADGQTTPEGWDCNGIYLTNEAKVAGIDITQPLAFKIFDGTQLIVQADANTGELSVNVPPAKVFKAGDGNWSIPNVSQAFIDSRIPSTLNAGEIDD
jgi:hypothetical protein